MQITLDDIKMKVDIPMQLQCDNKSIMSIVHNLVQHDRTNILKLARTSANIQKVWWLRPMSLPKHGND